MATSRNTLVSLLLALCVVAVVDAIAFVVFFYWTGTVVGAVLYELVFVALPSGLAIPWLYRRFRDQRAVTGIEVQTSAVSVLAYSLSAVLGACVGAAVFYVLFFFPTWIWNPDVMLLWGWFGTPLGVVAGLACFVRVTRVLGRKLVLRINSQAMVGTNAP